MNTKEIGELIKARRSFLKMRQEDIAEITGTTIKTLHLIELGKGNPAFGTLKKIADVLGLEIIVRVKQEPVYG